MSELYEKSLQKLELPQVLQLLSACAGSGSFFFTVCDFISLPVYSTKNAFRLS